MTERQPYPVIIAFPRGQLRKSDKDRLTKRGIIWIEADDPASVHQVPLSAPLIQTVVSGDAMITAALFAMSKTQDTMTLRAFVKLLADSICRGSDEHSN